MISDFDERNAKLAAKSTAPVGTRRASNAQSSGGRDDSLDDDLDRERLEPGPDGGGEGSAGADPAKPRGPENSNT